MFGSFGATELIIILVILLLLFGAKKLPELSRSIGQSAKELRGAMNEDDDSTNDDRVSNDRVSNDRVSDDRVSNDRER